MKRRTIVHHYQHHDVKKFQHKDAYLRFNNKTVTRPCFISVPMSNNCSPQYNYCVRRYTTIGTITLFQRHGELHMGPCQFKHPLHQALGKNPHNSHHLETVSSYQRYLESKQSPECLLQKHTSIFTVASFHRGLKV